MITKPCPNCGYPGGVAPLDCNVCGGSRLVHEFEPSDGLISDAIPLSERPKPSDREPLEYPDSFANYPASLSERRADADLIDGASKWTPRDVLLRVLRRIDKGEISPTTLVVCWEDENKPVGQDSGIGFLQASSSVYMTIGIMEACKNLALE